MLPKNCIRAKENFIGYDVKNKKNEDLGKIEDIVMDKLTGQTLYVMLESGGVFGMGSKFFAVPWNAFYFDPAKKVFLLDVDKERLKKAQGFTKENCPEGPDTTLFVKFPETTF